MRQALVSFHLLPSLQWLPVASGVLTSVSLGYGRLPPLPLTLSSSLPAAWQPGPCTHHTVLCRLPPLSSMLSPVPGTQAGPLHPGICTAAISSDPPGCTPGEARPSCYLRSSQCPGLLPCPLLSLVGTRLPCSGEGILHFPSVLSPGRWTPGPPCAYESLHKYMPKVSLIFSSLMNISCGEFACGPHNPARGHQEPSVSRVRPTPARGSPGQTGACKKNQLPCLTSGLCHS